MPSYLSSGFIRWKASAFALRLTVLALVALGAMACATTRTSTFYERNLGDFLSEGDRYYHAGMYQRALSQYSSFVFASPARNERFIYARYRMGLCHFFLDEFTDAALIMEEILEYSPNYDKANEAREVLRKSREQIALRRETQEREQSELQRELQRFEALANEQPDIAEYRVQLGDLYWSLGRYEDAVSQYQAAARLDPSQLETDRFRQRVRMDRDGDLVVRNPLLNPESAGPVQLRYVRLEPFYRSNWLGEQEFLRLTGEVHNNGVRDVRNVQVQASIRDFYGNLQGAQTANLGRIQAGARRPFVMQFSGHSAHGLDIRPEVNIYYDE